jgi:AbrB family looped-hinge helix DNA binding protein
MDILWIGLHNVTMSRKVWRHRITSAGQISIPAEVRARWGASNVVILDEGDQIVLRPVPESPIEAIRGVLRGKGRSDVDATEAVRQARNTDNEALERKWREHDGE